MRIAALEEEKRKYANIDMKIAQMASEIERLQAMLKSRLEEISLLQQRI